MSEGGFVMRSTNKPTVANQKHPVCPAALRYEALKAEIIRKGLSPAEYARACLEAARKAGL